MKVFKEKKIGRLEYFLGNLAILPILIINLYILLSFILSIIGSFLTGGKNNFSELFFGNLYFLSGINFGNFFPIGFFFGFFIISSIFYIWFKFFITIKRLRDIGWSAWLSIAFILFEFYFILFFIPGQNKDILGDEKKTKKLDF